MYIEKLAYKNVGPLQDVRIDFPFNNNGTPKPVILIGENGTGKSTILSNIVDSFYEMAQKHFMNATTPRENGGHNFFKTILPNEIHSGKSYMYSVLLYNCVETPNEESPIYICKSGNVTIDNIKEQTSTSISSISGSKEGNEKVVKASSEQVSSIWDKNVICYFGPDRYECPVWLGDSYYTYSDYLHPKVEGSFNGYLKNPITVHDVTNLNLQWLLDVVADSRGDIIGEAGALSLAHISTENLLLMRQARENLEKILSIIIGKDVYFHLNFRSLYGARFRIVQKENDNVICPTLDSLSTGQIALFNIFATIIHYADNNDITKSIHLDEITGIVVIDEIELHLHSKLQKEVLPKLIAMFPKIQFIITSHSPLFLLGMRETLGEDAFDVYEMPKGQKINVECFSEFLRAYNYIKQTQKFNSDIQELARTIPTEGKPLIITEGSTDWKHMKTAFSALSKDSQYDDIFNGLEFEFLEYEPKNSGTDGLKLEMGDVALCSLCENAAKLPHTRKYIFVADCDVKATNDKLGNKGKEYKYWGNNTYSLILPIPQNRQNTPGICIEHYYSDTEIKTEVDFGGVKRRLYIGNEFNTAGHNMTLGVYCEKKNSCGPESIAIIEGTSKERVFSFNDNERSTNLALPKMKFAEYVSQHPNEFSFSNFIEFFKILKQIILEESE